MLLHIVLHFLLNEMLAVYFECMGESLQDYS